MLILLKAQPVPITVSGTLIVTVNGVAHTVTITGSE